MEEVVQEVLSTLELELNRKDMRVLAALLKSQPDPATYVDFETIRAQLEIDEGERRGKDPLIYRSLSWLEKEGFIQVDRSQHKHGYNSNVTLLHKAFRTTISEKSKNVEQLLHELVTESKSLSSVNSETLAEDFLILMAGGKVIERPIFAEGPDDIFELLDDKIYKNLKKGDLVRFTVEWILGDDNIRPNRLKAIETIMANGVEFHGLEHFKVSPEKRKIVQKITEDYRKKGFNPKFRIFPRNDSTYQFVGRNDEGIVLFVSENPLSATWMPKASNPDLVTNAIESFDADFNAGKDILDFEEGEK
jgi:hypothetical protein